MIDQPKCAYPTIISSFKLFEYCKARYPKRTVIADVHPDYEEFYYWNRKGELRLVLNRKEIWVGIDYWSRVRRRR
jgi:hypothetical protein